MPVHSHRIELPTPFRARVAAIGLGGALLFVAPALQAQEPEAMPAPTFTPAEAPSNAGCGGAGQVGQGFVAFTGLGGRLASLAMPTTTPMQTMTGMMMTTTPATTTTTPTATADLGAGPRWNLMLGYKLCRVVVGVSLDLLVYSPTGSSSTATSFSIAPEVQIALARSRDYRAELIGALSVGLGQSLGFFQLSGTVAPGLRYWVHRHIALSTLLGLGTAVTLQGKGATVLLNLQGTAGVLGAF